MSLSDLVEIETFLHLSEVFLSVVEVYKKNKKCETKNIIVFTSEDLIFYVDINKICCSLLMLISYNRELTISSWSWDEFAIGDGTYV